MTTTKTTLDQAPKPDSSIHPRVVNGRTVHRKSNTAKPPKRTTKAEKKLHTRQAVFDRMPPSNKVGHRRPGSNKKS